MTFDWPAAARSRPPGEKDMARMGLTRPFFFSSEINIRLVGWCGVGWVWVYIWRAIRHRELT